MMQGAGLLSRVLKEHSVTQLAAMKTQQDIEARYMAWPDKTVPAMILPLRHV